MSTQSTRTRPSHTETKCPDCKMTLSRRADLKRHRIARHPDGTVVKLQCPFAGCQYNTHQKSDLNSHISARHSINRVLCPDCDEGFANQASRIHHRKKYHGYQPYHRPEYLAKQALKEAASKEWRKAALNSSDQQAANVVPHSTQNASSSSNSLSNISSNATYHNDSWKPLVDVPRRDASQPKDFRDVQICIPVAVAPARDTPRTLQSNSGLSFLKVGQQPSTTRKCKSFFLGPRLDTPVQPQSQALAQSGTAQGHMISAPVVALNFCPFATSSFASGGQSTYPSTGCQSRPTFS